MKYYVIIILFSWAVLHNNLGLKGGEILKCRGLPILCGIHLFEMG